MTKRRLHAEPRKRWTPEEDDVIRRLFPDSKTADIVALLPGRTYASTSARARKLGLAKSTAFLASPASGRLDGVRGFATRFQRGQASWNKGSHYVAGGRSAETRFRKGAQPHNTVAIGTTVKTTDGYWKVKVAEPNEWRYCHRMAWEDANGPIPKDMALAFKDGNSDHYGLENLELITRRDLMARNTLHNLPAPLPQLIQLRGALVRKINRQASAHEEQT